MLNNTEYMRIKQSLKGLLQQITSKEISLEDGLDKFQSFINVPGALDKHEWKYEKRMVENGAKFYALVHIWKARLLHSR